MFSPPLKKSIVFLKYALKMDLVKGEWFDLYERCKKCKYKYICLGGCPNLAYRVYNDVNHSNDFMCKIYKENAKKFLLSLFEGKDNV